MVSSSGGQRKHYGEQKQKLSFHVLTMPGKGGSRSQKTGMLVENFEMNLKRYQDPVV